MNFNTHSELEGKHAFFGGSKYQWINKTPEENVQAYKNHCATEYGTQLHEHAANCIKFKTKLAKTKNTLNMYVNDAIGYRMSPEVPLKYSNEAFGTADAIAYDEKKKFLRIHDLKTGVGPTHMEQLEVYAAFFCLEYHIDPMDISMELRIYQNDEVKVFIPDPNDIKDIMEKTMASNKALYDYFTQEEYLWAN